MYIKYDINGKLRNNEHNDGISPICKIKMKIIQID